MSKQERWETLGFQCLCQPCEENWPNDDCGHLSSVFDLKNLNNMKKNAKEISQKFRPQGNVPSMKVVNAEMDYNYATGIQCGNKTLTFREQMSNI